MGAIKERLLGLREGDLEMAEKIKFWASNNIDGLPRIISVWAEDAEAAREEIKTELSKPGRTHIRDHWIKRGAMVFTKAAG